MPPLLIAIGNPLRSDDGVAWQLAEQAARLRPALLVRCVQQLTPELSEELVLASRLLFLDAWLAPGGDNPAAMPAPEPQLRRLRPDDATRAAEAHPPDASPHPLALAQAQSAPPDPAGFSHALDPRGLLSLTQLLHGALPPAWELLLPAWRFAHGTSLSPSVQQQLPRALELLLQWCDQGCDSPSA